MVSPTLVFLVVAVTLGLPASSPDSVTEGFLGFCYTQQEGCSQTQFWLEMLLVDTLDVALLCMHVLSAIDAGRLHTSLCCQLALFKSLRRSSLPSSVLALVAS